MESHRTVYRGDVVWVDPDLQVLAIVRWCRPYGITLVHVMLGNRNTKSGRLAYDAEAVRLAGDLTIDQWGVRMREDPLNMDVVDEFMIAQGGLKLDDLTAEHCCGTQEPPTPEAHYAY